MGGGRVVEGVVGVVKGAMSEGKEREKQYLVSSRVCFQRHGFFLP